MLVMRPLLVDAITRAVQGSGMTTVVSVSHRPLLPILLALGGAHLLNDLISSMIPAMYPLLKEAYRLDFTQVGLITLAVHAAAGQHGFAQGIFQIGGHAGYAIGPLLAAMIVVPRGQTSIAWVSVVALAAMVLMAWTGARYSEMRRSQIAATKKRPTEATEPILPGRPVLMAMTILIIL